MDNTAHAQRFAEEQFGAARLGDLRRTKRLVKIAAQIGRHPSGSLPNKVAAPADLKALYRFANTEQVTHQAVLACPCRHTLELMDTQTLVLLIHDSTELDYTSITSLTGLGQIGNGSGRGYLCHNSLAVLPDSRQLLGLAHQILHHREDVPRNEARQAKRERESRESLLWLRACQAIGPAPTDCLVVDVCDRGADTFEFLDFEVANQRHCVVRSTHNRALTIGHEEEGEPALLHDYARTLPAQAHRAISVGARDGQPARQAEVAVSYAAVTVQPPRDCRGLVRGVPLLLWVVRAWEVNPPEGVAPVEWFLLTNVAVADVTQAQERLDWYECRWVAEEYHKCQKTGCAIEEQQFTTEEALQPMIAVLSVVAVLLVQLRDLSRSEEAALWEAREVVGAAYVMVLSAWRYHEVRLTMTVADFFQALARLGGHQNRKRDGRPGWIVIWRGWIKLQCMVEGAEVLGALERCGQT